MVIAASGWIGLLALRLFRKKPVAFDASRPAETALFSKHFMCEWVPRGNPWDQPWHIWRYSEILNFHGAESLFHCYTPKDAMALMERLDAIVDAQCVAAVPEQ